VAKSQECCFCEFLDFPRHIQKPRPGFLQLKKNVEVQMHCRTSASLFQRGVQFADVEQYAWFGDIHLEQSSRELIEVELNPFKTLLTD